MEPHGNKEQMDQQNKRKQDDAPELGESSSNHPVEDLVDMAEHAPGQNGCDDTGKLLVTCKTCGQTFHAMCLSPPLEHIPEEWQCLNCTDDNVDLMEPIANFMRSRKESICSICSRGKKKLRTTENKDDQSKSLKSTPSDPGAQAESDNNEIGEGDAVFDPAFGLSAFTRIDYEKLLMPSEAIFGGETSEAKAVEEPGRAREKEAATQEEIHAAVALLLAAKESQNVIEAQKQSLMDLKGKGQATSRKHAGKGGEIDKGSSGQNNTPLNSSSNSKKRSASGSTAERGDKTKVPRKGSASGSNPMPSVPRRVETAIAPRVAPSRLMRTPPNPVAPWCEFELDALWLGVRRHGQGNWHAILADPLLCLLRNKTPEALSIMWAKESMKLFPPYHHLASEGNNVNSQPPHTTSMLVPGASVSPYPHISGTNWFPSGTVQNEGLMWMNMDMPSVNNAGNSSGPSQMVVSRAPTTTTSTNPLASQILARNSATRMRSQSHDDDQALRAALAKMIHSRKNGSDGSSSSAAEGAKAEEPRLLLGGLFQLPKDVVLSKKPSTTTGEVNSSNERGKAKANDPPSSSEVEEAKEKEEPAASSSTEDDSE